MMIYNGRRILYYIEVCGRSSTHPGKGIVNGEQTKRVVLRRRRDYCSGRHLPPYRRRPGLLPGGRCDLDRRGAVRHGAAPALEVLESIAGGYHLDRLNPRRRLSGVPGIFRVIDHATNSPGGAL